MADLSAIAQGARIEEEYQAITANGFPHGTEADIIRLFKMSIAAGRHDERLPMSNEDLVVYEMAFKYGRADIVIFHADGSASVIEAKDGTKGYNHVVSGIGQAGLYAVQLAMSKGVLTKVRRCLLWTSTGDLMLDAIIEIQCEQSNTIALPWGKLGVHLAYSRAVQTVFSK